ncbi:MAG: hypothetical protein P8Y78_10670 [Acidihalobacter sp.]
MPALPVVSGTSVVGAGIDVAGAAGEAVVPADGAWDWLSDFPQPASSVMPIKATGAINLVFIRALYRFRFMHRITAQGADGGAVHFEASKNAYMGFSKSNSVPRTAGICNQALTSCPSLRPLKTCRQMTTRNRGNKITR